MTAGALSPSDSRGRGSCVASEISTAETPCARRWAALSNASS